MKKWWYKIIEKIGDDIAMQIAESSVIKGNINEIYSRIADWELRNKKLLDQNSVLADINNGWLKKLNALETDNKELSEQNTKLAERIKDLETRFEVIESRCGHMNLPNAWDLHDRIIALENEVSELKKYNQSVIEKDGAVCVDNPVITEQDSTTEDAFDTFLDSFDKAVEMLSGEVK